MGISPHKEGITIVFDCQFEVQLRDSRLSSILAAFSELLSQLLRDFIQKVLVGYGEYATGVMGSHLDIRHGLCLCCANSPKG